MWGHPTNLKAFEDSCGDSINIGIRYVDNMFFKISHQFSFEDLRWRNIASLLEELDAKGFTIWVSLVSWIIKMSSLFMNGMATLWSSMDTLILLHHMLHGLLNLLQNSMLFIKIPRWKCSFLHWRFYINLVWTS